MAPDILHVDLDAFFVSVARIRRPELAGRPVVVGGDASRGVVLSCSYEARAKGVRNGMPSARAKRLCPGVVFVAPDFETYTSSSKQFRKLLRSFTPRIEPISLDEAFCDVSGAHRLYGTSEEIASQIRSAARRELGLRCSVGGGETKLVAKMASRACKPDGALVVEDALAFLHPREIEELWGVGRVTAETLRGLGVRTIGDLAELPKAVLRGALGEAAATQLHALARGLDPSPVSPPEAARSVGAEETFARDIDDEEVVGAELLRLADRVSSRLLESGFAARTITVKIRLADFATYTRSTTLGEPTADVWTVFDAARRAYTRFKRGRKSVRLLGVAASGLGPAGAPQQLTLDPGPRYADAEKAMGDVRRRFGQGAVGMARLVDAEGVGGLPRRRASPEAQ